MARKINNQVAQELLNLKFQNLLKNRKSHSNLNFEKDNFTNYPFEDFRSIDYCYNIIRYSFYCYTLCKCSLSSKPFYLLRIADLDIVDEINFIFVCPAYKIEEDLEMAKRKTVLLEPNRLGLTAGKLSITLDDLPPVEKKLDHTNSYYDPKKKRRVPLLELIDKEKQITPSTVVKKTKAESGSIRNTDELIEGKLHSSHFLPPFVCERLWVLGKTCGTGWAWYSRLIEDSKTKYEFYCQERNDEVENMQTLAYSKFEFPELFIDELSHVNLTKLINSFETKGVESVQVVIDAILCGIEIDNF